jgi:PleD family two-component response regulator
MPTEPNTEQKYESAREGRRKFLVKIMVAKKNTPKKESAPRKTTKSSKTKNQSSQLQREIKSTYKEFQQQKTKIEDLAKATLEDLKKLHQQNKKFKATSTNNNNHGAELDYELINLKMINKILALSAPFEPKKATTKKKTKPAKAKAAPKRKATPKTKGQKKSDFIKILIIEDDRTTIKIIAHILEQYNFKVEYAQDAEEGLKMAFKLKPDLILLDIMLPGMDGFQTLSKLQTAEETTRIPVIILSSLSGEKDILKGLENGATDYVLKPFSPQILFFKIKKIMSLKNEHITFNRHV